MKSLVTSASCPSRRMVRPIVESDSVAARCSTGTIQQARPMNTSVVLRPMRMIASEGEGRFRKRAIAPTNTSANAVMAPTSASAICQTSIPLNRPLIVSAPFVLLELGASGGPEELLVPIVAHQKNLRSARQRRLAGAHTAVQEKLVAAIVMNTNLAEALVKSNRR